MTARFEDHILPADTLSNRPAASTVPKGTLYPTTDDGKVYRSDGTEWLVWATLGTDSRVKTLNDQTGTAYTIALTDAGPNRWLRLNNTAAITLTVPTNATVGFPIGSCVEGSQAGAGQVTIVPAAGVTVNATPGLKVAAQYGTFGLLKVATDTWLAYGRLSA